MIKSPCRKTLANFILLSFSIMEDCAICNSKSVIEEDENGQKVRVCTECGAMESDIQQYTDSADAFEGTTGTYGEGRAPDNVKSWMKSRLPAAVKGKLNGGKLLKQMAEVFKLDEVIVSEAIHLFERVYDQELYYSSQSRRRVMVVACLYATARIHRCGLTARNVGTFLDVENATVKFGIALKILKHRLEVHLPSTSITAETYCLLSQVKFPMPLIKQTQELMQILERGWLTSSRSSSVCIIPASYYVWIADNLANRNVAFTKYCKLFGFSYTANLSQRKRSIFSALQRLAEELPWIKASGKSNVDVGTNLKDVLQYQSSLMHLAIETAKQQLQDETNAESNDDSDEKDNKEESEENRSQNLKNISECGNIFRPVANTDVKRKYLDDSGETDNKSVNKKCKVSTGMWSLSPKEGESNTEYSSGNNSGLDSLDLGSDDDTDLYIIPANEIDKRQLLLLQAEVKDS